LTRRFEVRIAIRMPMITASSATRLPISTVRNLLSPRPMVTFTALDACSLTSAVSSSETGPLTFCHSCNDPALPGFGPFWISLLSNSTSRFHWSPSTMNW
jgi:hypothetical protein